MDIIVLNISSYSASCYNCFQVSVMGGLNKKKM